MNKTLAKIASTFALAFMAAACSPSSKDVSEAGFVPLANPSATMTCYDYNGNKVIEQKGTSSVQISPESGNTAQVNGHYSTYVSGGGGCLSETVYFDPDNKSNTAPLERAEAAAPYTAVVTNGSDRILLTGKFTDYSSGGIPSLELKSPDGTTLREIRVNGMQLIVTKDANNLAQPIRAALSGPQ